MIGRRTFVERAGAAAAVWAFAPVVSPWRVGGWRAGAAPLRIGIIGAGRIGGAVGKQWARAGHEILFSSRHPEELADLVKGAGPKTRAGLPAEAAAFGEVVLIATPFDALADVAKDHGAALRGKVVICCSNPSRAANASDRSKAGLARGSGPVVAELLPGARVTRAFNAINYMALEKNAHRAGEKVGIPVAGDDATAVKVTSDLVVDAGFDPVVVGGLARSKEFDPGSKVFVTNMTAAEIRAALGLR
jgi:hypothetical protein